MDEMPGEKQTFEAIIRDAPEKQRSSLENAVVNTLGRASWNDLLNVVAPKGRKYPIEETLFLRGRLQEKGLLCVDGFRERFPRIAYFDERTYDHRGDGQSLFVSDVNACFCEAKIGSIPNGGYCTDGFKYEKHYLSALGVDYLSYEKAREVVRGSESIHTLAGKYTAQKNGSECVYYYQNELDHVLTYLLNKCFTKKGMGGINDLGFIAMREAVANVVPEKFCDANWESKIASDTLYKMGYLAGVAALANHEKLRC